VRHRAATLEASRYPRHCLPILRVSVRIVAAERSPRPETIKMARESSPWWVWLTVAILAAGAIAYVTAIYAVEYLMAFF